MGEKKVTKMVLKVDLWCSKCQKKVKKVLLKFPQIQDQLFDEKTNTVTIKVVSCSPDKITDKLSCKGEGSIKSIEILEPAGKPKPLQDVHNQIPTLLEYPEPPQPQNGDNGIPPPLDLPKPPQPQDGDNGIPTPLDLSKPPLPPPVPVPSYPPVGWKPYSEDHWAGLCYQFGFGQERHYDWFYVRLVYESWGGSCDNRVYCRGRSSDCTCGRCSDCTCGRVEIAPVKKIHRAQSCKSIIRNSDHP